MQELGVILTVQQFLIYFFYSIWIEVVEEIITLGPGKFKFGVSPFHPLVNLKSMEYIPVQ